MTKGPLEAMVRELRRRSAHQLWLMFVHDAINRVSNLLGEDYLSLVLRRGLLQLYGARFGRRTLYVGKSYFGGANLVTGSGCYLGRACHFDFTAPIILGSNVVVGHGATFVTAEHRTGGSERRAGPESGRSIVIGDGTWVGANATILPGVTVGAGSIVAAGAVVTKDVPPDVVVAGVPAKTVKKLD